MKLPLGKVVTGEAAGAEVGADGMEYAPGRNNSVCVILAKSCEGGLGKAGISLQWWRVVVYFVRTRAGWSRRGGQPVY